MAPDYIEQILGGFQDNGVGRQPINDGIANILTERELEVLALLAREMSNQEIAERLVISHGTVKQHTYNIYQKLRVNRRWEAVTKATELGII